jgi:hypothetical protein
MLTRVVMVQFRPHVTPADVAAFKGWLQEVAASTPGLVRMTCGPHKETSNDAVLSKKAPDAVFCDFMSVWEFESESAVNDYLASPFHRKMAAEKFSTVVQCRYVANIA